MNEYCKDHLEMYGTICRIDETTQSLDKRINGSIDDIRKHIEHGQAWRVGIIGVGAMLVVQIIAFAYMQGQLNQKIIHIESRVWAEEKK